MVGRAVVRATVGLGGTAAEEVLRGRALVVATTGRDGDRVGLADGPVCDTTRVVTCLAPCRSQ